MTLAELLDMTRAMIGGTSVTDGALAQQLNIAQEHVSRELRIPAATVTYSSVTDPGAFDWPTDARDDGILDVYALTLDDDGDETASSRIPVYNFRAASMYDANWTMEEAAKVARFIVYDPTHEIMRPRPVPPPDASNAQSFRVTYVVRPTKMQAMTDTPFNGRLESFHDVLAYRVAYLLTRDAVMAAEYTRRLRHARGASSHAPVAVVNPLYGRTVVQSGRG